MKIIDLEIELNQSSLILSEVLKISDGQLGNIKKSRSFFELQKSDLTREMEIKNSKIIEQQRCIAILEDALRENNNIAEFEQLLAVVRSKDERINELEQMINNKVITVSADNKESRILELEDALKESIMIAAEREKVFNEEEQRRIETLQKGEARHSELMRKRWFPARARGTMIAAEASANHHWGVR
ncbi:hypothetical protein RR48_02823 [Papilio machaon]|uniref:Uncharacterized protein n=1 Tax=Papilio machaon TaxID=76193 RepID=A0A0N0PDY6_PAPMA|nr:hypothetical protein RR48_02823 [Papilio machaon]